MIGSDGLVDRAGLRYQVRDRYRLKSGAVASVRKVGPRGELIEVQLSSQVSSPAGLCHLDGRNQILDDRPPSTAAQSVFGDQNLVSIIGSFVGDLPQSPDLPALQPAGWALGRCRPNLVNQVSEFGREGARRWTS